MTDISWIGKYASDVQSFLGVNMGFPPTNTQATANKTDQQSDNPKDSTGSKSEVPESGAQSGFVQTAINLVTVGVQSYLDPDGKKEVGAAIDAETQQGFYNTIWVAAGAAIVAGLLLKK